MLIAKNAIAKIVVIRPGALGDVLAIRPTIRFFKDSFPRAEVCLVAPGERGRFFRRDGWADRTFDWDRGAFSWLFATGDDAPPPTLSAVFSGTSLIVAYDDFQDAESQEAFERRLDCLAPSAGKVFCPSRPPKGHAQPLDEWLLTAALGFCRRFFLVEGRSVDPARFLISRIVMPERMPLAGLNGRYFVIHPGSGSRTKNWPVANYVHLAQSILAAAKQEGAPLGMIVTAGEADGDAGRRLAEAVQGALLVEQASLDDLAALLAYSDFYLGNDSGVSHLAASVMGFDGRHSAMGVIFGPSDPDVWAPRGATVLGAGPDMTALPLEDACDVILGMLNRNGTFPENS